jgi:hypothetical protein
VKRQILTNRGNITGGDLGSTGPRKKVDIAKQHNLSPADLVPGAQQNSS